MPLAMAKNLCDGNADNDLLASFLLFYFCIILCICLLKDIFDVADECMTLLCGDCKFNLIRAFKK